MILKLNFSELSFLLSLITFRNFSFVLSFLSSPKIGWCNCECIYFHLAWSCDKRLAICQYCHCHWFHRFSSKVGALVNSTVKSIYSRFHSECLQTRQKTLLYQLSVTEAQKSLQKWLRFHFLCCWRIRLLFLLSQFIITLSFAFISYY